jgi:hypothetical protein
MENERGLQSNGLGLLKTEAISILSHIEARLRMSQE